MFDIWWWLFRQLGFCKSRTFKKPSNIFGISFFDNWESRKVQSHKGKNEVGIGSYGGRGGEGITWAERGKGTAGPGERQAAHHSEHCQLACLLSWCHYFNCFIYFYLSHCWPSLSRSLSFHPGQDSNSVLSVVGGFPHLHG